MKKRLVAALVALGVVLASVTWATVYLKQTTTRWDAMLGEVSSRVSEDIGGAGERFSGFFREYREREMLLGLFVYKERFEEMDVLCDQLSAFFDSGEEPYEELFSDLERLRSLVRDLYEHSGPFIEVIF